MSLIGRLHQQHVHSRRVEVLSTAISELLPVGARVLDIGSGDGWLAKRINDKQPDASFEGIDVLVRPQTEIPVHEYDGEQIPHPDDSFDVVMMIDVLHHSDDPELLLGEASRVARRFLLIKDHTLKGFLARPTLRFMDWIGNSQYGVRLPYNYWREDRWMTAIEKLGLSVDTWRNRLPLYPVPADWIFGRSLHFVARLIPQRNAAQAKPGA